MRRLVRKKKVRKTRAPTYRYNPTDDEIDAILCEIEGTPVSTSAAAALGEENREDLNLFAGTRFGKTHRVTRQEAKDNFVLLYAAYLTGTYKGESAASKEKAVLLFNWGWGPLSEPLKTNELLGFLSKMKSPGSDRTGRVRPSYEADANTLGEAFTRLRDGTLGVSERMVETPEVEPVVEPVVEPPEAETPEVGTTELPSGATLDVVDFDLDTPEVEEEEAVPLTAAEAEALAQAALNIPPLPAIVTPDEVEVALEEEEQVQTLRSDVESRLLDQLHDAMATSKAFEARYKRRSTDPKFVRRYKGFAQFISSTRVKPIPTVQTLWASVAQEVGLDSGDYTPALRTEWKKRLGKEPKRSKNTGQIVEYGWRYLAAGYGEEAHSTGTIILLVRNDKKQSTQLLIPSSTPVVSRGKLHSKVSDTAREGQQYWAPVAEFVSRRDLIPLINAGLNDPAAAKLKLKLATTPVAPHSMWNAIQMGVPDSLRQMLLFIKQWRLLSPLQSDHRTALPILIFEETTDPAQEWAYRYTIHPLKATPGAAVNMSQIISEIEQNPQSVANPRRRILTRPKKRLIRRVKRR